MNRFESLLAAVHQCTICEKHLQNGVRPVLQIDPKAKVLIVGQAPGRKVHESGVPFDDASGDRLRDWMGVTREVFYDAEQIAILPMGFCYPGKGKSGDLPPRPECAPAWRDQLLSHLSNVELTLLIGQYAQAYHLKQKPGSLTETVRGWRTYSPDMIPVPHPSPRNNIWLSKNPWFEKELLPELRRQVHRVLATPLVE
ncbi:uracil-DNA glycosylase family protein [Neptunomonas sp.]|uniref:uracil-DNA glycosylase family protein n=1 Tax=Neptunomonas sp. TaxID=1971898 RepID=UPI0035669D85